MLVLTPKGHLTCRESFLRVRRNTIRTKMALIIKNANTDLSLSSLRSDAIRAYNLQFIFNVINIYRIFGTHLFENPIFSTFWRLYRIFIHLFICKNITFSSGFSSIGNRYLSSKSFQNCISALLRNSTSPFKTSGSSIQ